MYSTVQPCQPALENACYHTFAAFAQQFVFTTCRPAFSPHTCNSRVWRAPLDLAKGSAWTAAAAALRPAGAVPLLLLRLATGTHAAATRSIAMLGAGEDAALRPSTTATAAGTRLHPATSVLGGTTRMIETASERDCMHRHMHEVVCMKHTWGACWRTGIPYDDSGHRSLLLRHAWRVVSQPL